MLDFILGLAIAAMLVRGWLRGFVKEALDLVGLVVGVWAAFRLSVPLAGFLSDAFGVSPEVARIGGGVLLFILISAGLSVGAHYLTKVMSLPGLTLINRAGGSAVAVGWGIAIIFVIASLLSVMPIPSGWRDQIRDSTVLHAITGEEAIPRRAFESVAGDNVLSAMSALRSIFDSARLVPVGNEVIDIPPAGSDEVRQVRDEAETVLVEVNERRVGMGLGAVQPVEVLTNLAEKFAVDSYVGGKLTRLQDCQSNLRERELVVLACDNAVALAGTALGGLEGIVESEVGAALLGDTGFDRAGVAVVEGPTGRLLILILAG